MIRTRPAVLFRPRFRPSRWILVAALAGVAGMAGCASSGSSGDEATAVPAEPGVNLEAGIPQAAEEVLRGTGSLTYLADEPGVLYLYDLNANQVVGQFNVREGQQLIVSGESGRATLGGNEVPTSDLRPNRIYIAYLLPTSSTAQDQSQPAGQGFRIIPDYPDEPANTGN